MRCLALGQAWQDAGGGVVFVTACQTDGLLQRLGEAGFDIHRLVKSYPDPGDWGHTRDVLAAHPDAWFVIDGYHFDETYQKRVKEAKHRLLVIDDMVRLKHYHADIILNQNLSAKSLHYSHEPHTRLLLGTKYVLLRREFLTWRGQPREIPEVARRVLVTLGGGDPDNQTLKVIQALHGVDIPSLEVTVVIGASNPHAESLEAAARQSHTPVRFVHDARNMPELMSWADVAIAAGGSTAWELAFMGLPAVFLVLAENQRSIPESLERAGAALDLGWYSRVSAADIREALMSLLISREKRAEMTQRCRRLVDGAGAQRVTNIIQETSKQRPRLRPVTAEDCRLLWEWKSDPAVRANSFNSTPIQWDEHQNWFRQKLADKFCFIYIVLGEKDTPVGQIRFDLDADRNAEINVSIDARERNKEYGSAALRLACHRLSRESNIVKVLAHIKEENKASIRAFSKAGFINKGLKNFKGHKAIEMIWPKE